MALPALFLALGGCSGSSEHDFSDQPATPEVASVQLERQMERAKVSARQRLWGESGVYLDDVLRIDPDHKEALVMAASVRIAHAEELEIKAPEQARAEAHKASVAIEHLQSLSGAEPLSASVRGLHAGAQFLEARILARTGETDNAVRGIEQAVASGFRLGDVFDDEVFNPLREREDFRKVVAEVKDAIEADARRVLEANQPFPFDFTLPDLTGKPVSLGDFKGKVTIVDFWGTWCGPCLIEVPHFAELYRKYQDKGLAIVGLTYEQASTFQGALASARKGVAEHKIPYPCLLGDEPTKARVPDFGGFPTTLFLDRQGKVRASLSGTRTRSDLEAFVTLLLAEPSVATE